VIDESFIFKVSNDCFNYLNKFRETYDCAELFFGTSSYLNIEVEENAVKHCESGDDEGVSIRVISKDGALGFSYTNRFKNKNIENMTRTALKMMKSGTPDPDFKDLPSGYDKYPIVKGLFDPNIVNLSIEEAIENVEILIKACEQDPVIISQSAQFSTNYFNSYIFNSNGIEVSSKETVSSISSHVIIQDKGTKDTSFGFDYQSERQLENIDPTKIVDNAIMRAKRDLKRKKVKNMKVPIILTPNGTISIILKPLASAVNAESYQYNRTFLVGKKGNQIGNSCMNVIDNALLNNFVGSSPFDGEGVPCQMKDIIKSGIFLESGLLHNSYTAGKDGVQSTGNASRHSYSMIPVIGVSNFILKPGSVPIKELIQGVKKGILLHYTGDRPNLSTGDFSGLIMQGNIIDKGEVGIGLNETMIGMNLLDVFKNIEAISKEYRVYGAFSAPYVKINGVKIIGSAI
jgi:PmbA protein